MPIYDYVCRDSSCEGKGHFIHTIDEHDIFEVPPCVGCGGPMKRTYKTVQFANVMQEHVNSQFGRVSSPKGLTDAAKRASEAASLRTGIEHNYQPADPSDPASFGVTGKGLEDTARKRRSEGLTVPRTPFT